MSEVNELRHALSGIYGLQPVQAVERLIGIYRHAKSLQDALGEIEKDAKLALTAIIDETGQADWKTISGRCYVTAPGVSVRYDAKALDRLSAADPKAAELLAPYRTEAERPGTLTIR
jgi:hypothetical protein